MRSPEADIWGLLTALALPTALFGLLALSYRSPDHRTLRLPSTSSTRCSAALLAESCPPFYPSIAPPEFVPLEQVCSPPAVLWTTSLRLLPTPESAPGCDFALFVMDRMENNLHLEHRAGAYADSAAPPGERLRCEAADGGLSCLLRGAPWRRYWVVPVVHEQGRDILAGEPIRLSFYRSNGLNLRRQEGLRFGGMLVIAGGLAVLLYGLRPGGRWRPRAAQWWVDVGLTGAAGGAITGMLYALRPSDLGGFDVARQPSQIILLTLIFSLIGGLAALIFADLRPRLMVARWRSVLLSWLVITALVSVVCVLVYGTFSSYGLIQLTSGLSFKTRYYIFFGTATFLPLIFYRDPSLRKRIMHGVGPVRTTQQGWLLDFGIGSINGLLATLLAIAAGSWLDTPPISASPLEGFYKPLSGFGLWLLIMPMLAAIALAINLGREAPAWVQALEHLLGSRARDTSRDRTLLTCQILDSLRQNEHRIPADLAHLGYCARQLRLLREHLEDNDLELLGEQLGLPPAALAALLQRSLAALGRAPQEERRRQTPLLLVDRDAAPARLIPAILEVTCYPAPNVVTGRSYEIIRDGHPLPPIGRLTEEVSSALDLVLVDEREQEQGLCWVVSFHSSPTAMAFTGDSYQLSLALLAWALASSASPLTEDWAASGRLSRHSRRVEPVTHLTTKAAILAHSRLLLSASRSVQEAEAELREQHTGPLLIEHVPEGAAAALLRGLHARLAQHLKSGGRAIIGVSTFRQAVQILYGGWI